MVNQKRYLKTIPQRKSESKAHSLYFHNLAWKEMIEQAEKKNISISEYLATLHKNYIAKNTKN